MGKLASLNGLAEVLLLSYFAFEGFTRISKGPRDFEAWLLNNKVH